MLPELIAHLNHVLTARVEILVSSGEKHIPPDALDPGITVPTTRLILLTEGEVDYTFGETTRHLAAGGTILIPAWTLRGWRAGPVRLINRAIEFTIHPPGPPLTGALWRETCDSETEIAAFRRLAAAHAANPPKTLLAEAEFKALYARFLNQAVPIITAEPPHISAADAQIRQAAAWLSQHMTEPAILEQLHEQLPLSPDHFRVLFKKTFGQSPRQYLTRLRMERARHLLRRTKMSINEISRLAGYHDPLYFSRHYRIYWGVSPRSDRSPLSAHTVTEPG